jgi:PAS domain S-box-containing protein
MRRGPSARASASAEARAELAAAVLSDADVADCARQVLRWLSSHTGVEHGFCAVVDAQAGLLLGLAGDGVPHVRVESFALPLTQTADPLVLALHGREPILLEPAREGTLSSFPQTPLGHVAFHVLPLDRPELAGEGGLGLLLLSGLEGPPGDDVLWAARLLSVRLLCARHGEARAAERRVRREQRLLRDVLNSVTDPIILTDNEGRMLLANTNAETLLTAEENSSEGRRRAVALNNMLFSSSLFTATEHGGPVRRELLLVDPTEGKDLLFELISARLEDRGSEGGGIVSILRDVRDLRRATEEIEDNYRKLKSAESEVRAERDRLDLILNAVADPVLVTNPFGDIVLMNPPAERLFTADPTDRRSVSERHIRANDVVFSSFVSSLNTMQALRLRRQLGLADPATGKTLPVEAIGGKLISKQGEVAGVVTILHDRTEALEKAQLYEQVKRHSEVLREKVQEATAELYQQNQLLRRQAVALEEASEAKSRFLANMSHELRTPLNAILGYTNLFLEGILGELVASQREKLVRVDANARHLVSLINDLLDIERIESGRMPVHFETFDIPELIGSVMEEVEPLINGSRLTVTTDWEMDLPQVESDRQKVKQIVINLLSNAIKFTPEGFVRVQVAYESMRDQVAISVADTGVGVAPELHSRIFEEFQQVDSSSARQYGGTGLGLAICKRLAQVIDGRVELSSSPGAGSTFTLLFPRSRA